MKGKYCMEIIMYGQYFFSAVATNNVITMYNFLYKKSQHRNKLKQKLITFCLYILSS